MSGWVSTIRTLIMSGLKLGMDKQSGFNLKMLLSQTTSNRFSKKMQQVKLKALEAGTLTDCYFLVGPEGGKIKVNAHIHFLVTYTAG